jgi:hypothetical protein
MEPYTQEYTGTTERLRTVYAPIVLTPHHADWTLALCAAFAVVLLIVLLARLPEPTQPATVTPAYDSYNVTSSYNNNSWNWDWCVGYCPR